MKSRNVSFMFPNWNLLSPAPYASHPSGLPSGYVEPYVINVAFE